MKKLIRKNKGITLVALVVTIVVLLILAGITINLILGPNSIFETAKKAGEETNQAVEKEQRELGNLINYINNEDWGNADGDSGKIQKNQILQQSQKCQKGLTTSH